MGRVRKGIPRKGMKYRKKKIAGNIYTNAKGKIFVHTRRSGYEAALETDDSDSTPWQTPDEQSQDQAEDPIDTQADLFETQIDEPEPDPQQDVLTFLDSDDQDHPSPPPTPEPVHRTQERRPRVRGLSSSSSGSSDNESPAHHINLPSPVRLPERGQPLAIESPPEEDDLPEVPAHADALEVYLSDALADSPAQTDASEVP